MAIQAQSKKFPPKALTFPLSLSGITSQLLAAPHTQLFHLQPLPFLMRWKEPQFPHKEQFSSLEQSASSCHSPPCRSSIPTKAETFPSSGRADLINLLFSPLLIRSLMRVLMRLGVRVVPVACHSTVSSSPYISHLTLSWDLPARRRDSSME